MVDVEHASRRGGSDPGGRGDSLLLVKDNQQALAAVRNVVVHLLEGVEASSKAAATRRFAARPQEALPVLFT